MDKIVCGDCIAEIAKLTDSSIDLVATSPPYAQQRKHYDGIKESDYPEWTVSWMKALKPKMKPDSSVAIVIRPHLHRGEISDYVLRTRLAIRESGWYECDELIWIKPNSPPIGNNKRPRRAWESILWFSQYRQPYCTPKANGHLTERMGMKGKKAKREGYVNGMEKSEDWQPSLGIARCRDYVEVGTSENDYSENNTHPAQYPVRLASWLITLLSPPDGLVLDPFMGSGTTAVACIKERRSYCGIDSDQKYCDMATRRIASLNST